MDSPVLSPDRVVPVYTLLAPVYDVAGVLLGGRARREALEAAAVRNGEAVLDVGTGTGLALRALAARNPDGITTGVDRTPAMLARARRRMKHAPGVTLVEADARHLPFASEVFDLVFSAYAIDLMDRPGMARVLSETCRVLRPGGRLVLVHLVPAGGLRQRVWSWAGRLHPLVLGGSRPVDPVPSLHEAGFRHVETCTVRRWGLLSGITTGRKP